MYRVKRKDEVKCTVRQSQIGCINALGQKIFLVMILKIAGGFIDHGLIEITTYEVKSGQILEKEQIKDIVDIQIIPKGKM